MSERISAEETRASLWFWPMVAAIGSLTFTLTVVALQLASQQFSPRLLREFARDRFTQAVLAVLISTFVVAIAGLRGVSVFCRGCPASPCRGRVTGNCSPTGVAGSYRW